MTLIYLADGAIEIPDHCPRWWELHRLYQSDDLRLALTAHLEVCTICQAWIEAVSNAGGEIPYLPDEQP